MFFYIQLLCWWCCLFGVMLGVVCIVSVFSGGLLVQWMVYVGDDVGGINFYLVQLCLLLDVLFSVVVWLGKVLFFDLMLFGFGWQLCVLCYSLVFGYNLFNVFIV